VVVDLEAQLEGEGQERECFLHFARLQLMSFGLGVKVVLFVGFAEGEEVVI
jgi:hypothetical protein